MDNSITRRGQQCWYRCVYSSGTPVYFVAKGWFHRGQRFFYVRSDNLFPSQKAF